MTEKQISDMMTALQCTREEAIDVIKCDEEIDHGEKLFELDAEQKKAEKKMRGGAKAVDAYGKTHTRNRPADEDKRELINLIFQAFQQAEEPAPENLEITNPEREINLRYNGRKFKVVLSAPRK